ncbi:GGDEF domain-containing protein [Methylocystis heyeri]|nr:GGDEF domain-containing protein [Methylocystis heyeri]
MSMTLPTLFAFNAFLYAVLAVFMLFLWREDRAEEFRFWSVSYFLSSVALALFAVRDIFDFHSAWIAGTLSLWSLGAIWCGVRVFAERPIRKIAAAAGGLIWLAGFAVATPVARFEARAAIVAAYAFLIACELSSYAKERLPVARATAALAALHGGFQALLGVSSFFMPFHEGATAPFDIPIVKLLAAEAMGYGVILGFMLLALSKARAAARQETAALTDPLTGLANRRAFDLAAERVIKGSQGTEIPVLLAFDLDRFKAVNDRFGHAEGDRALTLFARVAAANLRKGDIIARLGGEEFAALLIADPTTALSIADRIRCVFAEEAASIADGLVTVSVGVAAMDDPNQDFSKLMRAADAALYLAKAAGRNRVFLSPNVGSGGSRASRGAVDGSFPPSNAA